MNYFTYKEPYMEDGRKLLEVNILPEKYCTFNCIFCPVSRKEWKHVKADTVKDYGDVRDSLTELRRRMDEVKPDLVFINSLGEALLNKDLPKVIETIHAADLPVRLLSNGSLYHKPELAAIANTCEEVTGEIKIPTDAKFQKAQRPVSWCHADSFITNMATFREQYKGKFHLEITVVKGYSDDEASIALFEDAVRRIQPGELQVIPIDPPFMKVLGVDEETLAKVEARLRRCLAE